MQYQDPGQGFTASQELPPLPYPPTLFTYYNLNASQVSIQGGGLSGVKNFAAAGLFQNSTILITGAIPTITTKTKEKQ